MITLDLPIPFSVNKVRRIDWAAHRKRNKWLELADSLMMESRQHRQNPIVGPFEAHITVSQKTRNDLDNCIKILIDYAVRLKVVTDDSPDYLRRIVVEFGSVKGSRVVLKPFNEPCPHVTGWRRQQLVRFLFERTSGAMGPEIMVALYDDMEKRREPRPFRRVIPNRRVIPAMRREANRQLKSQGYIITATGGPGSVYRLERIAGL